MTFLENLTPLLVAAEKYAEAARAYEDRKKNGCDKSILDARSIASENLQEVAIEYAKWGKLPR